MSIRTLASFPLILMLALAPAACSDDDTPADTGTGTKDGAVPTPEAGGDGPITKKDKGKPDGPKKPAHWETVTAKGPAVWGHTATLLKDGKVLIVGGLHKQDKTLEASADTWIYLPAAKQILPAGKLNTARGDHTATLLKDGRVLVAGGRSAYSKYVADAEIFDPKKFDPKNPGAKTWSQTAPASVKRVSHGAALLPSGKVMVIGGYGSGSQLASLELFAPAGNSWSLLATKLKVKRSSPSVTVLKSGNVVIAGGYVQEKSVGVWHDTIEVYDVKTGVLTTLASKMQFKRAGHKATLMSDGKVLITGGYCGQTKITGDEIYDPVANKIKSISNPGANLEQHSSTALKDGRVLCTGGGYTKTKAVAYDSKMGGMWTTLVPLKFGRYGHTSTTLPDGGVLVVGGQSGTVGTYGPPVPQVEMFHP